MSEAALVLAIDTSTDVLVGLARGPRVVATRADADRRGHVEHLAPLVDAVLVEAGVAPEDLDRIVVGMGPGPFTGLRVGIATARVLGWSLGIDVHGVCSLDAVARAWSEQAEDAAFVVASDARRHELYWAEYAPDGSRIGGPRVGPPEALPDLVVVGPGADLYPQVHRGRTPVGPRSIDPGLLAVIGPELPDVGPEPLYLRHPDAAVPTSRKSTLVAHKRLSLRR